MAKMTYWQRRLQNPLHKAYNENEQATRQWLSVYQQASKDIKAEIFDTYQKLNIEKPLISDFYRYNNLQKIEKQINDSILQLGSKEVDYTKQSLQHATLVGSQAAADVLNTNVLNKSAIDELIKRPWHDANFSDRIWKNKAQLINSLKSELTNGIIQGKSIYEVANTIDGRLDVGRGQTQRLVRTEYMHALNQGQIESYRAKGYTKLKWIATMDDKTSKICRKLNRKEFDIENLPDIPAHPNCRCTMVPVITDEMIEVAGNRLRDAKEKAAKARERLEEARKSDSNTTKPYISAKDEWLNKLGKSTAEVSDRNYWVHNGEQYKVDGKSVVLDYSLKEKEVAKWVAASFGKKVQMVPRINYPTGIKTPDYLIDGKGYDLKEITGMGKNVVDGNLRKSGKQSKKFILDISKTALSQSEIISQIESIFKSDKRKVKEIMLIKNNELIEVFKKA